MLLLDTSAVSAFMHRRPDALDRLAGWDPSTVYLCAPVAAEIHFGLSRLPPGSNRRGLLTSEFQRLRAALRWTDWNDLRHFAKVDDLELVDWSAPDPASQGPRHATAPRPLPAA